MFYLMTWLDLDSNASVTIYGPYEHKANCVLSGRMWEQQHDDNPCWQIIEGELSINFKPAK